MNDVKREENDDACAVKGLRASSGFIAHPFVLLDDNVFYWVFKLNTENGPKT